MTENLGELREAVWEVFRIVMGPDFNRDAMELEMLELGINIDAVNAAIMEGDLGGAQTMLDQASKRIQARMKEIDNG